MRNLGPVTRRWLADADIHSIDDLRAVGAVAAYVRLRFLFGRQVTLNALYAMEACLRDIDWRTLPDEVKAELRRALPPA